jgi:PAS domain S-box-containing protein
VKILIADDNTDNLYYLEVLLRGAGHEVASARNGREALDYLSGTLCDLIISDILMPEMDGFQLCRECRKREDLDAIPFIFYTATYTDEKDKKLGLSIGADEYLIKPMEPDELLGVIDRVYADAAGKREEILTDEQEYLTEHNRRLIAKLEKKMAQLEENKQELERQVVERRQAEELIRDSEERFRTIFDTVSDAIFLQDIDTGLIVEMNRVTCDMFGYDRGELKSLSLDRLCAEDLSPYTPGDMRELTTKVRSGEPQFFEWKMRDREGRIFWVEILMKLVRLGTTDRMLVVIRDIKARKTAEEALNSERLKLKILSDNAPFGMVLIDREGRYTYINSKFRDMFGYDLNDIPDGRTWFRRVYPDDRLRQEAMTTWREEISGLPRGERKLKVFAVTCADGSQKVVNFIPLKLDSGDYLVTCEDITELKKLERQLHQSQKMEAIGSLAGGVAHDFNNILTTLMGYAGLLQMEMDRHDPLGLYVEQIISASQKAANLTRSLLAFSRQQPIVLNPVSINDTIRSTQKLLKRLLTEDVEFRVSLEPEGMVIMADATQIDQILFNLVANARDAMPKGGRLLIATSKTDIDERFVRAHGYGKPGMYVMVIVSDTGTGMDEATKEKIFDPFFSTKEVGKGTGLGLSTVYGIVKQHDGFINVYSEPGKGTTFRIYFPLVGLEAPQEKGFEPVTQKGTETILVAEDNADLRHLVTKVLAKHGYRTIEAVDGQDAIDNYGKHKGIDLIIVDSVMPKRNGREVYEEIRKVDPAVAFLFTSGHTKDTILNRGIADSEFDFLPKPIAPFELLQMVRKVLDRKKTA